MPGALPPMSAPQPFPYYLATVPRTLHPGAVDFAQARMVDARAIAANAGAAEGISYLMQGGGGGGICGSTSSSTAAGAGGDGGVAWGVNRCSACGHLKGGAWAPFHTNALKGTKKRKTEEGKGGGGGGDRAGGEEEGEDGGGEQGAAAGSKVPRCSVDMTGIDLPKPGRAKRGKGKCYHPRCSKCPEHLCRDAACSRCNQG